MNLDPPARLADSVVALRAVNDADIDPYVAAFAEEPELGAWVGIDEDPTAAQVRARAESSAERTASGRSVAWTVADAQSDEFLGSLLLHSFDWEHRRCEIGFWLVRDARRRGVGTHAVGLAIDWVFDGLQFERIEMTTTPDNPAVEPLALRLGFVREGVLRARDVERGRRVDIVWFGLLRDEWNSRR